MPPLVVPIPDFPSWSFTVTDAVGQPCLRYDDGDSARLTVGSEVATIGGTGGLGISITCPDGTSVQTANAFNLLSCPAGLFATPGLVKSWSDTGGLFISAGISTGAQDSVPVFDCRQ